MALVVCPHYLVLPFRRLCFLEFGFKLPAAAASVEAAPSRSPASDFCEHSPSASPPASIRERWRLLDLASLRPRQAGGKTVVMGGSDSGMGMSSAANKAVNTWSVETRANKQQLTVRRPNNKQWRLCYRMAPHT